MSDAPRLPERPNILLTIFHLGREFKQPLTHNEILNLIKHHDPSLNGEEVFRHWCELGHLRKRRGCFYVLDELGEQLQRDGVEPTLSMHDRRSWVCDNTTTGFW